jgi:signal transduction histidine kinase
VDVPDDDRLRPVVDIVNRLHKAHADERRRIARELHDHVAHALSVALNSLELHDLYLHSNPTRARAQLRAAVRAVRRSQETVRAMCMDLRTREVVNGLETALGEYLRTLASPTMDWTITVTGDDLRLPADVRDELFLIVREAVHNSLIHSSAGRVDVAVRIGPDAVRATMYDDGVGFDVGTHRETGGLASMHERARLLGGRVTLTSVRGAGTTVRVRIPLTGVLDE